MKKLIFIIALAIVTLKGWSQAERQKVKPSHNQISIFGGWSNPLGSYKDGIGQAKSGYFTGLAFDRYLNGGKWGLGLDARFLDHNIKKFDTVFFRNGHVATDYDSHPSFQHVSLAVGPTYKMEFNKLFVEAYLRGGVLFQGFPRYTQSIYVDQAVGPSLKLLDVYRTDNPERITKTLMGLGGFRFGYTISKNWGVFLQADYLRSFGSRFMGDSSKFSVLAYEQKQPISSGDLLVVQNDAISNLGDYYESSPVKSSINVQTLNIAAGVKFTFGAKVKAPREPKAHNEQAQPKEVLIVVKDKQTGLALSGVTVKVLHDGKEEVSITNASGEAQRLTNAVVGDYQITATKNGIAATPGSINAMDFKNAGRVIYKEIYHDDPRFTLIGETVSANDDSKLPGISTVLTNTGDNSNMSQTSDAEAKFVYQLGQQSDYQIVANQAGRFSQTEGVTTKGLDRSKTLYVTLKLGISKLGEGVSIVLKNIHYDFDQSAIRPDAARILNNLVNVMNQNPTLNIELSSHTDSRGKDDYNLTLSQKRADAAVQYLVSKGIERSRLVAKGYGEQKLLNKCANGVDCGEEAHQANRRTEVRILKY